MVLFMISNVTADLHGKIMGNLASLMMKLVYTNGMDLSDSEYHV